MFAGEVLIVIVILLLARRMNDTPPEKGVKLDLVGTALSAAGLGLIVFGILRSGTWGFVQPKAGAPEWLGLSPVIWLMLAGGVLLVLFAAWENRRLERGEGALIDPAMLRNLQLRNGVTLFLFLFLVQAGIFFIVPLFLSVALGHVGSGDGRPVASALADVAAVRRRSAQAAAERVAAAGDPPRIHLRCSPGSCSWSPCSTTAPARRSSPGRCCLPAPGSARSPRSSAA